MTLIWLIPVFLSQLLLAAHFLRDSNILLSSILLLVTPLLIIRKGWVAWLFRVLLFLGAIEWFRTIWVLAVTRIAHGQPFLRMAIILGVVTLFTFVSAFVFHSEKLKNRYFQNLNIED